jgi:hypothetical protein
MADRSVTNNPGNRGSQPAPDTDTTTGNSPAQGQPTPATGKNAEQVRDESGQVDSQSDKQADKARAAS